MAEPTLYETLGVDPGADLAAITRAFRARSIATHPDKNPGDPAANARFIEVVKAYQTLSDLYQRAAYDARVLSGRSATARFGVTLADALDAELYSVMDTPADDVLEEYVVGNVLPRNASMMTFFRDLERTEVFILLREGKAAFQQGDPQRARELLHVLVLKNPHNIVARYYYGLALFEAGRTWRAYAELRRCLQMGELRRPARLCPGIRRKLDELYRRRGWYLSAWWLRRRSSTTFGEDVLGPVDRERRRLHRLATEEAIRLERAERALPPPRRP